MKKIVIFPNPNQILLLREIQKEICSQLNKNKILIIPIFPIYAECYELKNFSDKITELEPCEIFFEKEKFSLKFKIKINEKFSTGKIELCQKISQPKEQDDKILKFFEIEETKQKNFQNHLLKIKRLSPFRIVEIDVEEAENRKSWKIMREKWGKIN